MTRCGRVRLACFPLLLLLLLCSLVSGREYPPFRVALVNTAEVLDTWVVYEVQLYFGFCHEKKLLGTTSEINTFDSGTRRENPENVGWLAFDGRQDTNWTADCKAALGGCKPHTAFIGQVLAGHPLWVKAMDVNATAEDREKLNVNCVRFFQSDDPKYKADKIAIVNFFPGCDNMPLGYCRSTLQEFDAAGGQWTWRPAPKGTMWRVTNLSPTTARWAVSELRFYRDHFCTFEIDGPFMSESTHLKSINSEKFVADGDDRSSWVAGCDITYPALDARPGCKTREGWIGKDFSEPLTVRCVKMTQKLHNPNLLIAEKPSYTLGIALERWNGVVWIEEERFYYPNHHFLANETPSRTLETPYFGIGPGASEDTRPPNYGAWRIANDDWTVAAWRVHEMEFYETDDCVGDKLEGDPVSVQGPAHKDKAALLFDGDLSQDLYWESSCVGNGTSCTPEQAWFGLYFRNKAPRVKCIRILQSRTQRHTVSGVLLSVWLNGTWQPHAVHREIGGGCWNRRPAAPWSMWRVLNVEPIPEQWKVFELRAYMDPLCLKEVYRGDGWEGLTSGHYGLIRDKYMNAFDSQAGSAWGADCQNCTEPFEYWLGAQLPNMSEHLWAGAFLVRCIKYWGSPHYREQSRKLRVDVWNGEDWEISPLAPGGLVGGGGSASWVRNPAVFASQWRLVNNAAEDMAWRFHEVEFYSDSGCSQRMRSPHMGWGRGGADFFISGYRPMLDMIEIAKLEAKGITLFSEGSYATDQDGETSVLIEHRPSEGLPAWYALDALSETSWVRCVRLKQSPLLPEQVTSVRLEMWDGAGWSSNHREMSETETLFTGLGGGGWQRRPAADGTIWRLENLESVHFGWAVYEIEFHGDTLCADASEDPWAYFTNSSRHGLRGDPVASGYIPPTDQNGPDNAFDADPNTAWLSQCGQVNRGYAAKSIELPLPVGCAPREAWIGMDFGQNKTNVQCVRIRQIGDGNFQSENVAVAKWNGTHWADVWKLVGLGGTVWDQRPAFANSMWRVVYKEPFKRRCRGEMTRPYIRPWGVNELRFYEDDECTVPVTGGRPIGSGTMEAFRRTYFDPPSYDIDNAFDDESTTLWGAQCKYGWKNNNRSLMDCRGAFLGLDFRDRAIEARCMKIMQSRIRSSTCCDVASELAMERWNGTAWVEATWRHEPPVGYHDVETSRQLGASFVSMGQCLEDSTTVKPWDALVPETRMRKDSDNCVVPLSGSTTLLGEPACMTHPKCADVISNEGFCCPLGQTYDLQSENRCCCNYLQKEAIFLEEVNPGDTRVLLQIEYATILLSDTLPIPGFFLFVIFTICAWAVPGSGETRFHAWAYDEEARKCPCPPRLRKVLFFICWPVLHWRAFLDDEESEVAKFCRWHVRPDGKIPGPRQSPRLVLWLLIGMFVGGVAPWVAGGLLASQILLRLLFMLALSIKWSKSRFNPEDHRDMKLRQIVTKIRLKDEDDLPETADVGRDFFVLVVTGTTYFLKFTFDLLVFRAQMISVGSIPSIKAERIVDIMPGLISLMREPAVVMYKAMLWASEVMAYVLSTTIGIPQCQGTCVLYGSMFLVATLVTACIWQNYDFFGLFAASRQVAKSTRPECQRAFAVAGVLGCMSVTFAFMQCAMILLTRSLTLANPFTQRTWMCEYDDTSALYIGRALMGTTAIAGLVTFFLTVNGHFMGQDYILTPLGKYLDLDLLELDPDGTGPEGGMFRFDVFGSIIPTIPGIWVDWWNVKAFLVKERARVYAEQLRDPQPCLMCGQVHVKYNAMFVATGRQVSLACQIIPFGVLVGKLSEYLNDPPLYYMGKDLPCATCGAFKKEEKQTLHKSRWAAKILLQIAETLCYFIDYGLPALRRASNFVLYYLILMGTFSITEDNLVEQGRWVITMGFAFAFLKAGLEQFSETFFGWIVGVLHKAILMIHDEADPALDVKRTVAGQCACGASIAAIMGCLLPHVGLGSIPSMLLSWASGFVVAEVVLVMARQLEEELVDAARMPRGPGAMMVKIAFSFGLGGFVGWLGSGVLGDRAMFAVPIPIIAILLFSLKLLFIERTSKPRNGVVTFVVNGISFERFMKEQHKDYRTVFYTAIGDAILTELPGPTGATMKTSNVAVSLRATGEGIPIKVMMYPTNAYSGAHAMLQSLGNKADVAQTILERIDTLPDAERFRTGEVSVDDMKFETEMEGGVCNKEMQDRASPALRVLLSGRWLSPCVGSLVASTLGSYVFDGLVQTSPLFAGLLGHGVGVTAGFFAGMAIDKLLENYAQIACLFAGSAVGVGVSQWNVLTGILAGVFVGTLVGSVMEEIDIRHLLLLDKQARQQLATCRDYRKYSEPPEPLKSREECLEEALAEMRRKKAGVSRGGTADTDSEAPSDAVALAAEATLALDAPTIVVAEASALEAAEEPSTAALDDNEASPEAEVEVEEPVKQDLDVVVADVADAAADDGGALRAAASAEGAEEIGSAGAPASEGDVVLPAADGPFEATTEEALALARPAPVRSSSATSAVSSAGAGGRRSASSSKRVRVPELVDNCSFERDDFEAPPPLETDQDPLQALALPAAVHAAPGPAPPSRRAAPSATHGGKRLGRAGAAGAAIGVAQPSLVVHRDKRPPDRPTLRKLRDATVGGVSGVANVASAAASRSMSPSHALGGQPALSASQSLVGPRSPSRLQASRLNSRTSGALSRSQSRGA